LGALTFGIAAGLHALWPTPPGISKANFARIKPGMSQAEVEATLGGPPGDYRTPRAGWFYPPVTDDFLEARWEEWAGDRALIDVAFDEQDRVLGAHFLAPEPSPAESFLDRLRRLWP
jgi:hypothetical protein